MSNLTVKAIVNIENMMSSQGIQPPYMAIVGNVAIARKLLKTRINLSIAKKETLTIGTDKKRCWSVGTISQTQIYVEC